MRDDTFNYIGTDGWSGKPEGNVNPYHTGDGLKGVYMYSEEVDPEDINWGTMALTTTAVENVSYRTSWARLEWNWTFREVEFEYATADDGAMSEQVGLPLISRKQKLQALGQPTRTNGYSGEDVQGLATIR